MTETSARRSAVPQRRRARRFRPATAIAVLMLSVVAFLAFVVPLLPHYAPMTQDLSNGLLSPFKSSDHVLGTDQLGRDTLSRISLATRVSLGIVVAALFINLLIGVVLGVLAGYFGRVTDSIVMGLADLQLAIPVILLLIVIVAVIGSSPFVLAAVLGLSLWVGYGRVARVVTRGLREREFVLASVTEGARHTRVIRKHILPNVMPHLIVLASFDAAVLIIVESSLSYLGLGIQAPTPSLGGMISEGQKVLQVQPFAALVPGIVIFLWVAGIQFLSQTMTPEGARVSRASTSTGGA